MKNLGYKKLVSFILLSVLLLTNVNVVANSFRSIDKNILLNEMIFSVQEGKNLSKIYKKDNIKEFSKKFTQSYKDPKQDRSTNKNNLSSSIQDFNKLTNKEVLAVKNLNLDQNNSISKVQKRAAKQINNIVHKYVDNHFGEDKNIFNLSDTETNKILDFVDSNQKIQKLSAIIDGSFYKTVDVKAAWWENCHYETGFNNWAKHSDKSYYGRRANWVGRTATDWHEKHGVAPCDFSFYIDGYRVNEVDAWSIATYCAVKNSGGMSIRRYGYYNQKAIIGHTRLTVCGMFSFNTSMLRDQIRFY